MQNQNPKHTGSQLLSQGYFLGDTSGKTKNLEEKSVFAICSKNAEFTIKFESRDKIIICRKLQKKHKFNYEDVRCLMQATKIYYATKGFADTTPGFYICCDGFDKRKLTLEVQKLFGSSWQGKKFKFELSLKEMFGKHNMADRLAYKVNKEGKKANMTLTEKHFQKIGLI